MPLHVSQNLKIRLVLLCSIHVFVFRIIHLGREVLRCVAHADLVPKFAAAAGHVDLCASLIRSGADKRALVYEGPSQDTL